MMDLSIRMVQRLSQLTGFDELYRLIEKLRRLHGAQYTMLIEEGLDRRAWM